MAKRKQEAPEEEPVEIVEETSEPIEETSSEEVETSSEETEDLAAALPQPGAAVIYYHDPKGKQKPWPGVLVAIDEVTGIATLRLETPSGESVAANVPYGDDFGHWEEVA